MINIDKWAGLVTNASAYAIPPGSMQVQVNLQCLVPGKLTVRSGTATLPVSSADTTNQPIVSAYRYQSSGGEHLVYQDAQGRIFSSVKVGTA